MLHAGVSLIALARGDDGPPAGPAAAALRLAVESLDARRKLEGLLTPAEAAALLGPLPPAPPSFRYVVQVPQQEGAA
jgi:hypothetical protein